MPPSARELREFEPLRGRGGGEGFLALPAPTRELRERVSSGLLRGCGASGGFLALPPALELRGLGLLRGGSGSEGFLALPPELWEIESLGSGGGAAIFRPQEHRGEWSMAVQSLAIVSSKLAIRYTTNQRTQTSTQQFEFSATRGANGKFR